MPIDMNAIREMARNTADKDTTLPRWDIEMLVGTSRAHRIAYWMWNGQWFAEEVKLRHSCDVRNCCNPMHLQPGSQADNMRDRWTRSAPARRKEPAT